MTLKNLGASFLEAPWPKRQAPFRATNVIGNQ